MYDKTMLSILAKSLIISFQCNIEIVYFFYSNPVILVRVSSKILSTYSLLKDSRAVCVVSFFFEIVVYKKQLRRKVSRSDNLFRWFKYPTFQQWNPSPSSENWHCTYNYITALLIETATIKETFLSSKHLKRLSVRHNYFF